MYIPTHCPVSTIGSAEQCRYFAIPCQYLEASILANASSLPPPSTLFSHTHPAGLLFGLSPHHLMRQPLRDFLEVGKSAYDLLKQKNVKKGAMKKGTTVKKGSVLDINGVHSDGQPLQVHLQVTIACSRKNRCSQKLGFYSPAFCKGVCAVLRLVQMWHLCALIVLYRLLPHQMFHMRVFALLIDWMDVPAGYRARWQLQPPAGEDLPGLASQGGPHSDSAAAGRSAYARIQKARSRRTEAACGTHPNTQCRRQTCCSSAQEDWRQVRR